MRKQYWYKIYNNILCSEIEYSHLLKSDKTTADLYIKIADLKRKISDESGCFVDTVTKQHIYFCNQVGIFQISNGSTIEICPNPGIALEQLTPFVFGYCIAMLFWQRDMLSMHCSSVEKDGKALIICGNSGSGKSTLTTTLLDNGFKLMTDDVAVLSCTTPNQTMVYPAFPLQKLCRDAAIRNSLNTDELWYIDEDRDKFGVPRLESFCDMPIPLKGIVFLGIQNIDSHVHFNLLNGHEKLISFLENNFLFPMFRNSNVFSPADMKQCMNIVQTVPAYKLLRPIGIDSTKEQMNYILNSIILAED